MLLLAPLKRNDHPHLTTLVYSWDPEAPTVRFSTTADRVKVQHLQHNPRAALHVSDDDVWSFAHTEGKTVASESTTFSGDAAGQELLEMIQKTGSPEDKAVSLEELVAERQAVIRLKADQLYGTVLDINGLGPTGSVLVTATR